MTLAQLEALAATAARGSFTLAAAQLGITQSGVSHAIRALERELGVSLIRRSPGAIELTDVGARILPRANTLLGLAETMRQEAQEAQGMKRGTLRIGSFGPTASVRLLPPLMEAYRQRFPGIAILVDEGPDRQVLQWLLDRRVDIGFVVLPEDRFETFPLIEDQMVALLPTDHRLAGNRAVALADLCHDPFVLTEAGSSEIIDRLFANTRSQPDIRYRTSQLLSTLDLVTRGAAISIVAASSLPEGEHHRFLVKPLDPPVRREVALAVLSVGELSPAATAFIELASQNRGTHPAGLPVHNF